MSTQCTGPECSRRGGTSGLCRSHYKQRHLGKPLTPLRVATKDLGRPSVCSVDDCGRPHKARGLCKTHKEHLEKYGEFREIQRRDPGRSCRLDDCDGLVVAHEFCRAHVHRVYSASRYGITYERYEEMLAEQGGGCAICGGVNENGHTLYIDHDHACCPGGRGCGKCVRGLLCAKCNLALGNMRDDPARLRAAADYLERAN